MVCRNCGVDLVAGAAYCPCCGKRAEPLASDKGCAPTSRANRTTGLRPNVAGLLCYLAGFLTGAFFLLAEPYKRDHFVRFHALQAIWVSAAWLGFHFSLSIVKKTLGFIAWSSTWLPQALLGSVFFFSWVLLMYKAYHYEEFKLPIIGRLAAKHA